MRFLLLFLILVPTAAALAHSGATGVVKDRMDLMKSVAAQMKTIGDMVKGQSAFDAVAAASAADAIGVHAQGVAVVFPEGSMDHPSEATAAIWQNWDAFMALSEEMRIKAAVLSDAAAAASAVSAIRPQFMALGQTCSDCHTDFRKTVAD